ncbi:MAG: DUF3822 family protein [Crocinitomicaceae bacterium]|nr:DUF3822 family protein [Crocinitomicaceae bacterium]
MYNNTHLAFELSEHTFQISEINANIVKVLGKHTFEGSSDREQQEELIRFLESVQIQTNYEAYTLSWVSHQFTLVPTSVFKASDIQSIFNVCFAKRNVHSELDYNELNEQSITVIYEIPDWVKAFFTIRFPRILIQHAYSHLVRGVIDHTHKETCIHISLFESYLHIALFKNKHLIVSNSYEYVNEDDILYYVLFCLQQNECDTEKGKLSLHISGETKEGIVDSLLNKWKMIKDYKAYTIVNEEYSLTKHQLTCV